MFLYDRIAKGIHTLYAMFLFCGSLSLLTNTDNKIQIHQVFHMFVKYMEDSVYAVVVNMLYCGSISLITGTS